MAGEPGQCLDATNPYLMREPTQRMHEWAVGANFFLKKEETFPGLLSRMEAAELPRGLRLWAQRDFVGRL